MMTKNRANAGIKSLVKTTHKTRRGLLFELLATMNQTEAATLMGIGQGTLSSLLKEPPRHWLSPRLARSVADHLGVERTYICKLFVNPMRSGIKSK